MERPFLEVVLNPDEFEPNPNAPKYAQFFGGGIHVVSGIFPSPFDVGGCAFSGKPEVCPANLLSNLSSTVSQVEIMHG